MTCAVDGDPKPQIYWQFNFGNDFPAARERRMQIMDNDESFIIDNAKSTDRGVYTCTAENPAGIITTNVTVDISKYFVVVLFFLFLIDVIDAKKLIYFSFLSGFYSCTRNIRQGCGAQGGDDWRKCNFGMSNKWFGIV